MSQRRLGYRLLDLVPLHAGGALLDLVLLRRLAPGDRRAVLLGLAVLVPALLFVVVVRPYHAALIELREQAAQERSLLQREVALLADGAALPRRAEAVERRAQRATGRLVRAANVPLAEAEVTGFLESVAGLSNVLLQELRGIETRRGEAATPGDLRPIRLSLRGESDLEGVLTFLHRVETSPLFMRVVELSLEPQYEGSARTGDRRTTGVLTFALIVDAYAPSDIESPTSSGEVPQ
jgi:hypothetical protein